MENNGGHVQGPKCLMFGPGRLNVGGSVGRVKPLLRAQSEGLESVCAAGIGGLDFYLLSSGRISVIQELDIFPEMLILHSHLAARIFPVCLSELRQASGGKVPERAIARPQVCFLPRQLSFRSGCFSLTSLRWREYLCK